MSPNELSELVPLAETLNKESDDLNRTIAALNDRVGALNLGITVWTGLLEADDDPESSEYEFGFTKLDGNGQSKWQFVYRERSRTYDDQGELIDDDDDPKFCALIPLLQASRNRRIEGLETIPVLLKELKYQAEQKIKAMQAGKKLAGELGGAGNTSRAAGDK